mmetsp:Transcript_2914/g.3903  ORF Transcript_2914/g.3903 Transcript_2914/m.3903 type:complete len:341 (+) Transcript_2914:366-1388(+)
MSADTKQTQVVSTPQVKSGTSSKDQSHWAHFIAGGVGGGVAAFITCPLEVIKTRNQALHRKQLLEQHAFGTRTVYSFLDIYRTEGVRGLFKGLGPNLVGVAPARALHFSTYSGVKRFLVSSGFADSSAVHLTSAIVAGISVHTITGPIWLVKTRMQLQISDKANPDQKYYKNSFDCVRTVFREEGIRGFYKGLVASYFGVSESALQFVLYEKLKTAMKTHKYHLMNSTSNKPTPAELEDVNLSPLEYLTMASAAKLVAAAATYPHEVVRTRMREQRGLQPGQVHKYTGFFQALKLIAVEEGTRGLYGGMGAHLIRVTPNAAIMFLTYETIVKLLTKSAQQ